MIIQWNGINVELIEDCKVCAPSDPEEFIKELSTLEKIKTEHVVIERDVRVGFNLKLLKDTDKKQYILSYDEIDDNSPFNGHYLDGFVVRFPIEALESIVSILRAELENNSEW